MRAIIIFATIGAAAVLWQVTAGAPAPTPARTAASPHATQTQPAARPSAAAAIAPSHAAPPSLASIEAAVRDARKHGKGEQEVHRLRSASMPAAQVEALARMEAAETSWRQRVEALQSACAENIGCDDARASFTHEELARTTAYAPPTLRQ